MEITKMLTLSTSHITKETATLLSEACMYRKEISLVFYQKRWYNDYSGWFIYIPEELETYPEDYQDIPDDLMQILLFAKHNDCTWICLDCDGEEVDCLEVFYW